MDKANLTVTLMGSQSRPWLSSGLEPWWSIRKWVESDTKEKNGNHQMELPSAPPLTPGDHSNSLWPRPQGLQSDRLSKAEVGGALERLWPNHLAPHLLPGTRWYRRWLDPAREVRVPGKLSSPTPPRDNAGKETVFQSLALHFTSTEPQCLHLQNGIVIPFP